jgi:hypothetical protein
MTANEQAHLQSVVANVKAKLRVTKVTATRSVKTGKGDFFVGFSAAWDSVQDDTGTMGGDADLHTTDAEIAPNGMTMEEARVAHVLLSMEASIAAWRSAHAEGVISAQEFNDRKTAIKRQHAALLSSVMGNGNGNGGNP